MRQYFALVCFATCAFSQTQFPSKQGRLITEPVNESRLQRLAGNTRPEAVSTNDQGKATDTLPMEHMQMLLRRPANVQAALDQTVKQLHDKNSPSYHHWLTADQFNAQFGAAPEDVAAVKTWLESKGFQINALHSGGMIIDFSGNAGQVNSAFKTEIHHLTVDGASHVANMSDPQIPAALGPAVRGIISLHDFKPHAHKKARPNFTDAATQSLAVTPGDLSTIYNLNPLFDAGITGKGQTIAVLEDVDLYAKSDWDTFRTKFGLDAYTSGSLSVVHPGNCADPGVPTKKNASNYGDDGEAILDAEWASAAAPDAAIQVASCANTNTSFGGQIALVNMVNSANPPSIVSISYGECEALNGEASNASFNTLYQQAAAEGISVFVSAGDEGAASCDAGTTGATHGIGVSAFASTPYNVAVGGTDFSDTFHNTTSTYWSPTNTSKYASALSYIPEMPWNESCAGSIVAASFGYSTPYGSTGFCGSSTASKNQLLAVAGGSGGPSGCATGTPASNNGVVDGSCAGYAKPDWQSGLAGIPNDGVRDIPDISLFAASGLFGHYYVYCWTNIKAGGASCGSNPAAWAGAGGTSFAAPILAGVQALVNQNAGAAQGNPNPVYYSMAATHGACNSSDGNAADSSCIFYNVTEGDITVNCSGSIGCYGATTSGTTGRRGTATANGELSTNSKSDAPAFKAAPGWNFATGIGSINAYNLVMNWNQ